MKKEATIAVLMIFLGILTNAQPVQAPAQGGTLDQLIQSIQENTAQNKQQGKLLEDIPGRVENIVSELSQKLIIETCLFMVLLYLGMVFVERVRKRFKLKGYEQKIDELKTENRKIIKETDSQLVSINRDLKEMIRELDKVKNVDIRLTKKTKEKIFINGLCFGFLIATLVLKFSGVF